MDDIKIVLKKCKNNPIIDKNSPTIFPPKNSKKLQKLLKKILLNFALNFAIRIFFIFDDFFEYFGIKKLENKKI
jgi:hypothetical protein